MKKIAAGGLIEKDGKFLLVKENKKICKGKWNIPAGRVGDNENVIDAASNLKNKFDYLHYWSPFIDTNKFIFMTDKTKIHYDIVIDDKTLNLNNCNI